MIKTAKTLLQHALRQNKQEIIKYFFITILFELISISLLYGLNSVYGTLYQGIQQYKTVVIWHSIAAFTTIAMILVGINGYMSYFINLLSFALRTGLTNHSLDLEPKLRNRIPFLNQRIQEDLKRFGENICELGTAVFRALLKLPIFLFVIVQLTHWYTGLIILVAVILGTWLTKIATNRLIPLQVKQESLEAQFREFPSVTYYSLVTAVFLKLNKEFKRLAFVQSGLGQVFVLLPFIVLMPLYISKAIAMGAFFQAVNALGKIIESLSVLIDSRQTIVNIQTCIQRLNFLDE